MPLKWIWDLYKYKYDKYVSVTGKETSKHYMTNVG